MEIVSIGTGAVLALIGLGLGWLISGWLPGRALGTGVMVLLILGLGFAGYRIIGPRLALEAAFRTPGNPLSALAQSNPDMAGRLKQEMLEAYYQGGEAEMTRRARDMARGYIRGSNAFVNVSRADDQTVNQVFSTFAMLIRKAYAAGGDACADFLAGQGDPTLAALNLSESERQQAIDMFSTLMGLSGQPTARPYAAPPPPLFGDGPLAEFIRGFMNRRSQGDIDPMLLGRAPAGLSSEEKGRQCRTVLAIFDAIDGAREPIRTRIIRGLFERLGQAG